MIAIVATKANNISSKSYKCSLGPSKGFWGLYEGLVVDVIDVVVYLVVGHVSYYSR